jgi:hypothetical protein
MDQGSKSVVKPGWYAFASCLNAPCVVVVVAMVGQHLHKDAQAQGLDQVCQGMLLRIWHQAHLARVTCQIVCAALVVMLMLPPNH